MIFEAGDKVDFEELMFAADFCLTTSTGEGFGMVFLEPWTFATPVIGRDLPRVTADLKEEGMEFPLLYGKFKINRRGQISDFPDLDMDLQMDLIKQLMEHEDKKNAIMHLNPFLNLLLYPPGKATIKHNIKLIKKKYSLKNFKKQLDGVYQKLS